MPMKLHRADQRGIAEYGWLHSRFSFSFDRYYDPRRMGFGALRVINDDVIEPKQGFGLHPHRNMEIITLVTEGSLEHHDSAGHHGIIRAGEIQYMSAGTGIRHSEINPSATRPVSLFQIWIRPAADGMPPHYEQRTFAAGDDAGRWRPLVSGDGREGSIRIAQDALIFSARLRSGAAIDTPPMRADRGQLLLVVDGDIEADGRHLARRDEVQITEGGPLAIRALDTAWLLLFDVPLENPA